MMAGINYDPKYHVPDKPLPPDTRETTGWVPFISPMCTRCGVKGHWGQECHHPYVFSVKAVNLPRHQHEYPEQNIYKIGMPEPDRLIMSCWHWTIAESPRGFHPVCYHTRNGNLFAGIPWCQPTDLVPFGMKGQCRALMQDKHSLKLWCCNDPVHRKYQIHCEYHLTPAGSRARRPCGM